MFTHVFASFQYFNPRTREGCDGEGFKDSKPLQEISIHAPVKGATLQPAKAIYAWHNFNPRTREGCDLMLFSDGKLTH